MKEPRIGGLGDADIAHPARFGIEGVRFDLGPAQELDQHGATDVETLLHHHVHLGIEVVALLGERSEVAPDDAGRDEEDRKEDQCRQGDLPTQIEHRRQHDEHRDQIAHHVRQEIGEGLLRAEDVVVQPADQGTGLGPGEEGQGHALDVAEHLRAHVEDQTLADDRGDAALGEGEHGVEERQPTGEEGQADDQVGVVVTDPIVDQGPEDERVDRADCCVEYDHGEEHGQDLPVADGERHHAPCRALLHPVLQDGPVPSERAHAGEGTAAPATHGMAGHAHQRGLPMCLLTPFANFGPEAGAAETVGERAKSGRGCSMVITVQGGEWGRLSEAVQQPSA